MWSILKVGPERKGAAPGHEDPPGKRRESRSIHMVRQCPNGPLEINGIEILEQSFVRTKDVVQSLTNLIQVLQIVIGQSIV